MKNETTPILRYKDNGYEKKLEVHSKNPLRRNQLNETMKQLGLLVTLSVYF